MNSNNNDNENKNNLWMSLKDANKETLVKGLHQFVPEFKFNKAKSIECILNSLRSSKVNVIQLNRMCRFVKEGTSKRRATVKSAAAKKREEKLANFNKDYQFSWDIDFAATLHYHHNNDDEPQFNVDKHADIHITKITGKPGKNYSYSYSFLATTTVKDIVATFGLHDFHSSQASTNQVVHQPEPYTFEFSVTLPTIHPAAYWQNPFELTLGYHQGYENHTSLYLQRK
jgi:hypothetical protein